MKRTLLAGSAAALLLAAPLQSLAADGPSWDYLSLGWVVSGEIKEGPFSEDFKGYRLEAVKSIGDVAFVRAVSNAYHIDVGDDVDFSTQQVGIGARYRVPAGPVPVDIWGSLNYERVTLEFANTGLGVDLGVRAQVLPALDVGLTVKAYGDLEIYDEDLDYTGYELSAAYAVHPLAGIQLTWSNYELDSDMSKAKYKNVVSLGVRFDY